MGAVSFARAARLMIGLRWRRIRNRLLARGFGRRGHRPGVASPASATTAASGGAATGGRTGTAGKSRNSWFLALIVGIYMPVIAFQQARRALDLIAHAELGVGEWGAGGALPAAVLRDLSVETATLMLAALLLSLANKELSAPEWDLEWTATLPIPTSALLAIRILERAVVNPSGFVLLWPFATVVAQRCGFGWGAPILGAGVALTLLIVVATVWTVIDTGARLALPPPQLRNLQALFSLASIVILVGAVLPASGTLGPLQTVVRLLPRWADWAPPGLAILALTRQSPADTMATLGLLLAGTLVTAAVGLGMLSRLLRHGIVSGGGRESARRSRGHAQAPPVAAAFAAEEPVAGGAGATGGRRRLLSTIHRRELRLLGRDRNFLVQTLLLPLLIVGLQIFLRTRAASAATGLSGNPAHVAAAAFGIAAYGIMFSAFQTLNAEGHALWILYTLPHRLESVLRQKAMLWGAVSMVFPAALLGLSFAYHGVSAQAIGLGAIAIAGVPIYATIATALGVFASDPLSVEVQRRLRPAYVYLYIALAGTYTFALYASGLWQRGVLMVLTALVALALWQKARDQLPYLLDPAASPGARVSVADGLIAALIFFLSQALVVAITVSSNEPMSGRVLVRAFLWAGAVTFAIMRLAFWRLRSAGVPRLLGARIGRALVAGAAGALVASAGGIAYLLVLRRIGKLPAIDQATLVAARSWLLPLAIVAAPIFEEFIFRGLIFGGLRRSFGGWAAALASAGIFAIVHPPLSAVPVFFMGLVAALVYDRAGMLLAPMVVHAGYNAAVALLQPLLTG